jgi:hypothetical protein
VNCSKKIVALLLGVLGGACREAPPAIFTDVTEARRLAADLTINFAKATGASSAAVVADDDARASGAARDAKQLKDAVKRGVGALGPRLRRIDDAAALEALQSFERRFAAYDKVDQELLDLVVENTNLKAQRLTFGPGREAADDFREALESAVAAASPGDRCRAEGQAAGAVAAVREIEVLWAPHIAEADDAAMTRFEQRMASLEAQARRGVAALGEGVGARGKPALVEASAALERFSVISKDVVALSRRNTHVRSVELALRRRPALAGPCDESLRALGDALAKDPFPATR